MEYQQSIPQQILLSLGWGPSPQQRLLGAARRLAGEVQTREAAALARLVADSGDARPAEVEFTQPPLLHWRTDGGARRGSLSQIQGYYRELHRGRLVVQGPAGAGKTVLAIALTRDLNTEFLRTHPDPPAASAQTSGAGRVAVRVSASAFDPTGGAPLERVRADQVPARLDDWLAGQLRSVYGVGEREAAALVAGGWILPVLDGVDEMDPPDRPPWRAAVLLAALNHPVRSAGGGLRPVVVTCRTDRYADLTTPPHASAEATLRLAAARGREPMQDANIVQVEPLTPAAVGEYLLFRFPDPAGSGRGQPRWRPVLDRLATATPRTDQTGNPTGEAEDLVVTALRSPLRLFLAVDGYRDPTSDPSDLTRFPDTSSLDAHLFALLIPASAGLHPRPGGGHYTSEQVTRWMTTLAHHLDDQDHAGGSGTDLLVTSCGRPQARDSPATSPR